MAAQLEQLGNFATVVVLVSAIWVMVVAIQNGMPYLGVDGEFATVGFDNMSNVANAVSTFGFCFYVRCMIHLRSHMLLHLFISPQIQPIMMPMLAGACYIVPLHHDKPC